MSGASGSRSSGVIGRAVGHHLHEEAIGSPLGPRGMLVNPTKKTIFSRNARHASGGSTGHLCPLPTGHSPSPFPFMSHPFSLFRPSITEGWCPSCVHYNSLGWGFESLGCSVVLQPMSACPRHSRLAGLRASRERARIKKKFF
eukprot:scaffold14022_cov108-Isochrysis_galbana.AAC.4